ncbi:hypothetical protein H2201_007046 [Coniosporium apollinis]|uniref:NACHT domain-containing protein n=1 Tax=Coniosporium apollinis TaxID=61459 RepID=A0ABQ9NMK2_9PEZI|nr:hypothetical protein H2201_007046 [Coniosporium apollinis]
MAAALQSQTDAIPKRVLQGPAYYYGCKEQRSYLQMLYNSDYKSHKNRIPRREHGTCQWFLQHPKYQEWYQTPTSSLLWLSADPGCGKSVLAAYLVDELEQSSRLQGSPDTICYFFFKDDNEEQQSATNALRALLHQVYSDNDQLTRHVSSEYETKSDRFVEEFDTLWNTLVNTALDPSAGHILCVIDALDECEACGRRQLMSSIINFYSGQPEQTKGLKFFVTSRPYPQIERNFRALPHIRLRAEAELTAIGQDIELVIRSRVSRIAECKQLSETTQKDLERKLIESADQTFIWVSLVLSDIEASLRASTSALQNLIDTIPADLDAMYERILSKGASQGSGGAFTLKILQIVVGAARPLSLEEMNIALAIGPKHQSISALEEDLEPCIGDTIRGFCGLFVRVIDENIYLVHQTAKEFLLSSSRFQHQLGRWKHSIKPYDSERLLAEICLRYLLLSDFEACPLHTDSDDYNCSYRRFGVTLEQAIENYTAQHRLIDYAAKHWTSHFRAVQQEKELLVLALKNCVVESKRFWTWFAVCFEYRHNEYTMPWGWTELHVAAWFGHQAVVEALLNTGVDPDLSNDEEETPLWLAADRGHDAVVKLLLDAPTGVDMEARDMMLASTPLLVAARKGHVEVARLLLEKGADPGPGCKNWNSPIGEAALHGHVMIVRLLLEKGVDPDFRNEDNETPLSITAQCAHFGDGKQAVVKLLLEKGADPNALDYKGVSPLRKAAKNQNETMVKLLLDAGANPNFGCEDDLGRTALSCAAEKGCEEEVKLLLDKGMSTHVKDKAGDTALSWAARGGHEAVVKLLLDHWARLHPEDGDGCTPLLWAVSGGHRAVAKLLIQRTLSLYEEKYRFQLLIDRGPSLDEEVEKLSLRELETLAELMVEAAVNPKFQDKNGLLTIGWAAYNGHKAAVELLGKWDDSLNLKDYPPLWRAVGKGLKAAVRLLLEKGADPNIKDPHGRTLLGWAASEGNKVVVKMLLEHGVNPNSKDSGGQTALSHAASQGHGAVVKLLIERDDVDPDSRDTCGHTPLWHAMEKGHDEVVSLLLKTEIRTYLTNPTPGSAAAQESRAVGLFRSYSFNGFEYEPPFVAFASP